jgi:hypothetical protein
MFVSISDARSTFVLAQATRFNLTHRRLVAPPRKRVRRFNDHPFDAVTGITQILAGPG